MLASLNTFLFDLDGTLTVPAIDFGELRRRLDVPPGISIAHALNQRPVPLREKGFAIVHAVELQAARNAVPNRGAKELLAAIRGRGHATALITRNSPEAVEITLRAIGIEFGVIITRDFGPMKPSPQPVLEALRQLGTAAHGSLTVGDFQDDIIAGRKAGTATCLIMNGSGPPQWEADLYVPFPADLHALLQETWHSA